MTLLNHFSVTRCTWPEWCISLSDLNFSSPSPSLPPFLHFSLFYFVHYKQLILPQVTCLICVHKYGRICNAIVCTESHHVRCMDLTNCYGRVLFKDR